MRMGKVAVLLTLFVGLASLVTMAGKPGGGVSTATAKFLDKLGDKIRSDGGEYVNGQDDVTVLVRNSGDALLELDHSLLRVVTLEFSQPLNGDFPPFGDQINVNDIYIAINDLFNKRAAAGEVYAQFEYGGSKYVLDYDEPLPFTGDEQSRTVKAEGDNAVAKLNAIQGRRAFTVGKYNMPFELTITKQ